MSEPQCLTVGLGPASSRATILRPHAQAPLAEHEPREVGGYQLIGRLGQGGMGVVYLAADPAGQPVALKRLHLHLANDPAFVARFSREARLSERVRGPFTADVLDYDLDASPPWLATEYIPGPTLAAHIVDKGPLLGAELTGFALAVAEALRDIHAAGVIHRDLTPQNVLLAADGPRVVDFGIAGGEAITSLTATGQAMGTPGSVAPEIVRGDKASAAADVFAWGALVCFAASGTGPYGTGTPDQLLYRLLHGTPSIPPCSEPLAGLLVRALASEPADRPTPEAIVAVLTGGSSEQGAVTQLVTRTWTLEPEVTTFVGPAAHRRRPIPAVAKAGSVLLGLVALVAVVAYAFDLLPVPAAETVDSQSVAMTSSGEAHEGERTEAGSPETQFVDDGPPPPNPASESPAVELNAARDDVSEHLPEPASKEDDPPTGDDPSLADEATGGMGSHGDPPQRVYDVVAEQGFEVRETSFWDPDMPVSAVTGSFTGSATGRGMRVFFFTPEQGYLGTDTSDPSETVWFEWRDENTIAVSYALYRDGDPGCCPTGGAATVRYVWDGDRLSPADEIPPTSGPIYR